MKINFVMEEEVAQLIIDKLAEFSVREVGNIVYGMSAEMAKQRQTHIETQKQLAAQKHQIEAEKMEAYRQRVEELELKLSQAQYQSRGGYAEDFRPGGTTDE